LRHNLRNTRRARLGAFGRREPLDEFLAVRERERVEIGPELCRRQRAGEIGGYRHRSRSGVDLERDVSAAARDELRGIANLLARRQAGISTRRTPSGFGLAIVVNDAAAISRLASAS
jgi:hypothetical protein